jgi:hypothetical protein
MAATGYARLFDRSECNKEIVTEQSIRDSNTTLRRRHSLNYEEKDRSRLVSFESGTNDEINPLGSTPGTSIFKAFNWLERNLRCKSKTLKRNHILQLYHPIQELSKNQSVILH